MGNYSRLFIMLQETDKGFGINGKPTGYAKIEVKNTGGKVLIHIQNINRLDDNKLLKAYLLSSKTQEILSIGAIELKRNQGDATYQFDQDDFKKHISDYTQFDTVVIACKDTNGIDRIDSFKAFPLVGFKGQSWDWKSVFSSMKSLAYESNSSVGQQEIKSTDEHESELEIQRENNTSLVQNEEDSKEEEKEAEVQNELDKNIEQERIETKNKSSNPIGFKTEYSSEQYIDEKEETYQQEDAVKDKKDFDIPEQTKIDYSENKSVTQYLQDMLKKISRFMQQNTSLLDDNMGYKWWALKDYRFILDHDVARIHPTFFQNSLMIIGNLPAINAQHRYGHFLLGIKENKQNSIQHIAFAIPARYGIEPHPLLQAQAYARWIPRKGERHVIGAMGYWLTMMDAKTGEFVFYGDDE